MKLASLLLCISAALPEPVITKRSDPLGIDVSSYYQSTVDWNSWKSNGVTFAYIKATEGTTYTNPDFSSQYTGATNAGLIRGGYHFAHPDSSTGATQASYFLKHDNPSGSECYGLSASSMVSWIKSFSNQYHSSTARYWKSCTGNSSSFASISPLWIAHPALPSVLFPLDGRKYTTFWQYGTLDNADGEKFNGDSIGLKR
ncbi:glycoside hydrolase family 25 protein [Suillus placidus]|uniref:Glycoside hydrolase family 25 protein n=1 Tax=Suillus placidus TaxID=48579 RepID=A0A9P7A0K2_9AGAM|nr:glycoside hydrolase family 25 protein [Suillus placidus]